MNVEIRPIKGIGLAKYNPRKISDQALDSLVQSIERFGFVDPVIVNDRTGILVGGHQRIKAAKKLGLKDVPVVAVNLDEAEEKALNVALNKISGEWDLDLLRGVLEDVQAAGLDLSLTGFTDDEWAAMGGTPSPVQGLTDPDEVPEIPEETETITKPGDLWILGDHRLLCGDSTKAEDVARLMDGAVAEVMVTDPPYGVEYDADWRNQALTASKRAVGKVTNDDKADWREVWSLFGGDVAYVWHAGTKGHVVAGSLLACGFDLRAQVVWAKSQLVIGRGDYHPQHEPCWYAVRKGKPGKRTNDRKQTTLWSIDKPRKSETGHSTQKPVECMARPLANHQVVTVFDPFLGSGTTLIAAEQLGRKCYGLEISPQYCDVIVKRWEQFTGKKAHRAEAST